MIAAFISRAVRDPDYPTKFADSPVRCPYTRPFEHASGCGCIDCETRRARRFRLACAAVLLLIALAVAS
jgi:hypothetical protein